MSTITLLCIALAGVIMLLLLVIKAKVQPFVALLLVSLLVALAAGIPAGEVGKVMIAGMGGVLGSVTIIIGLGAMLGRMIEHSGGAESLANYFSRKLGDKRTIAALTLADAPRDKCTLSCAINGIHAAFHYLKKNYISGCVMTVPTGW